MHVESQTDSGPLEFEPPEFFLREDVTLDPPYTIAPEPLRVMLARVLSYVPYAARMRLACDAVLASTRDAAYFSAALLKDRSLVLVDSALLEKSRQEQLDVVLPLIARVVRQCPHEHEDADPIDFRTFYDADRNPVCSPELVRERLRAARAAQQDHRVEAFLKYQSADRLAAEWVADRKTFDAIWQQLVHDLSTTQADGAVGRPSDSQVRKAMRQTAWHLDRVLNGDAPA